MQAKTNLNNIISELKKNNIIRLINDSQNETTYFLVCPAEKITPEHLNFMVNYGRGIICAPCSYTRVLELGLPLMVSKSNSESPDFTVSVESRSDVSTGISNFDKSKTLQVLASTLKPRQDLVTPGHIMPIRCSKGGVLVRSQAAEASIDLLQLANLRPVAAMCCCLDSRGELLTERNLTVDNPISKLPKLNISEIIRHRLANEEIIEKFGEAMIPLADCGLFHVYCFLCKTDNSEHLAFVKGDITSDSSSPLLVRVQSEDRLGDLLGTHLSLNRSKMLTALNTIEKKGRGVFVYVRRQDALSSQACSTEQCQPPSIRQYGIGAQILRYLQAKNIHLLTSSEKDMTGISAFDINIVKCISFK